MILTGNPAVAGTYNQTGTADGKPYYTRNGLINELQYHLYRRTWFWDERWHTAWFLTTNESGYPTSTQPFWSRYTNELGDMNPASQSGATGTVVLGDSSQEVILTGSHAVAGTYNQTGTADGEPITDAMGWSTDSSIIFIDGLGFGMRAGIRLGF